MELHDGLGSALSQLDRRDDAAAEFRWVVANGRSGRPEVDSARKRLTEAGGAGGSAPVASAQAAPEDHHDEAAQHVRRVRDRVRGPDPLIGQR